MNTSTFRLAFFALVATIASSQFTLAGPNVTQFDVPGSIYTAPLGINNAGDIVGTYVDSQGRSHGFLRKANGAYTTIDPSGSTLTQAIGINEHGQIVGTWADSSGFFGHAFVFDGTAFQFPEVPGWRGTQGTDISNSGILVGNYFDFEGSSATRGFTMNGGLVTTYAPTGTTLSEAFGVNSAGDVVGFFRDSTGSGNHGYLYSGGTYTILDVAGSTLTAASDVNELGTIVGSFYENGQPHGFAYSNGTYNVYDFPGQTTTNLTAINDFGIVTGHANGHGFIGSVDQPQSATPEPTSWVIAVLGVFTIVLARNGKVGRNTIQKKLEPKR